MTNASPSWKVNEMIVVANSILQKHQEEKDEETHSALERPITLITRWDEQPPLVVTYLPVHRRHPAIC